MNGLFDFDECGSEAAALTVYLRCTHLDVSVFADIVGRISGMHRTAVGACENSFLFPDVHKDRIRNVLHIGNIATSGGSMTIKIREGWAPAFEPAADDFLLDVNKNLGLPTVIAYFLASTIDKTLERKASFMDAAEKAIEKELVGNAECKAFMDALEKSGVRQQLEEQAMALVQRTKSIEAVRSLSINGVNILSFDVNRRKYKRYFVNFRVFVAVGGKTVTARALNLSRGGCVVKLEEPMVFPAKVNMTVQFPGADVTSSDVTLWNDRERSFARLIFDPPMEEGLLHAIVNGTSSEP